MLALTDYFVFSGGRRNLGDGDDDGDSDGNGSWLGELAAESGSWAPEPEPEPPLPILPEPEPEPELIIPACRWLDDSRGPGKPPIVRDLECGAVPWLAVPSATVTLADPCCQEKLLVSTSNLPTSIRLTPPLWNLSELRLIDSVCPIDSGEMNSSWCCTQCSRCGWRSRSSHDLRSCYESHSRPR